MYLEFGSIVDAGKFWLFSILIILVEDLPTVNNEINKYPIAMTDARLQRPEYLILA